MIKSKRKVASRREKSIRSGELARGGVVLNGLWRAAALASRGSIQLLHLRASLPLRCWRIKP